MAKAQGLLTGPSLSEVQVLALSLLETVNIRENRKASSDAIKNAIISANPRLMKVLYPELSTTTKKDGEPGEPPPSTTPPSMSEVDEMDQWIQQASSPVGASMSGADLYGPDDGWE